MKSTIRTENKDSRTGTEIDRQLKRGNGRADKCSNQRVSNNWRQQNTIMPSWTFPVHVNKSRIFYLSRNNVWFKCSFMFWNSAYSIYTKNYTNNSTQVILMKANAKQGELTKKAVSDQNKNPHASDTSKFNWSILLQLLELQHMNKPFDERYSLGWIRWPWAIQSCIFILRLLWDSPWCTYLFTPNAFILHCCSHQLL